MLLLSFTFSSQKDELNFLAAIKWSAGVVIARSFDYLMIVSFMGFKRGAERII